MRKILFALTICLLSCTSTFAQEKSLPGNEDHDRAFYLLSSSEQVILPDSVLNYISTLDNAGINAKYNAARKQILKVIFNPAISANDKLFFNNRVLKMNAEVINPIKKYLSKN